MRNKLQDYEWRRKNKYKALREIARLIPTAKEDVDAVFLQRRKCAFLFVAITIPTQLVWVPFYILHEIASVIFRLCELINSALNYLCAPKRKAFKKLHELALKAEHGEKYDRAVLLKNRAGWDFEPWHYVNREDA